MNPILIQASLLLGVIPALILLFINLRGYEKLYKEKNIFLTFIVGIILGGIAAVVEQFTIEIGLLFIVLFPILEQLLKTIALNIGRFHEKQETVVYGLSLGVGFGSVFIPFSLISFSVDSSDLTLFIILGLIGSIGFIFLHGATGICIGYGVYAQKLMKYFIFAVILHIPVTSLFFLTGLYQVQYLQAGVIVYGIIVYWYCTTRIMSKIQVERQRRKRGSKEIDIKISK